jgi:hypothetical protein
LVCRVTGNKEGDKGEQAGERREVEVKNRNKKKGVLITCAQFFVL